MIIANYYIRSDMRVHYLNLSILLVAFAHLVASSHYRGGTIQWRPDDPKTFNGVVRLATLGESL